MSGASMSVTSIDLTYGGWKILKKKFQKTAKSKT